MVMATEKTPKVESEIGKRLTTKEIAIQTKYNQAIITSYIQDKSSESSSQAVVRSQVKVPCPVNREKRRNWRNRKQRIEDTDD